MAAAQDVFSWHCCWLVSAHCVSAAATLLGVEKSVLPPGPCQVSLWGVKCVKGTGKKKMHLVWSPGGFQAPTWREVTCRKLRDNLIALTLSPTSCSVSYRCLSGSFPSPRCPPGRPWHTVLHSVSGGIRARLQIYGCTGEVGQGTLATWTGSTGVLGQTWPNVDQCCSPSVKWV